MVNRYPTRSIGRRRGAKVPVAAAIFLAAAFCFLRITPPRANAQDKPPAVASSKQNQDQSASATSQPTDLSDEVVREVLSNFQRGIETHNLDLFLEVFDASHIKDWAEFHDRMVAFFRLHDSVKFRYQLLQVTADNGKAFAIADLDMDADPSDTLPTPQRRSTQMRFQLRRTPNGWKVVGLKPTDFFNQ